MEAGLHLPAYRRPFRGGKSIVSLWRLSRFVTKLFVSPSMLCTNGNGCIPTETIFKLIAFAVFQDAEASVN